MAMLHDLIVRPMRSADAPAVIAMACALAAAVDDPKPPLTAADLVRDGTGPQPWFDCLVAELARRPVAYVVLCKGFEAHTAKRRLWIGDLYVEPAARRAGVGRALLAAIARHGLALGCDAIYWELWRMNSAGEAFYRRLRAETADDLAIMRFGKDRLAELAAEAI
jgi:GNAT superfamily N-acetyltransferase